MKIIHFSILIFIFVVLPVYMLNSLVMPELTSLQNVYAHAEQTSQTVVNGR